MTERQTITVSINAQDLPGMQHVVGAGARKEITSAGMLGVANHTGIIELMLNNHVAVRLCIHEDKMGHAVIAVYDITRGERLGIVDVELYGLVPPRRNAEPKKERRFDPHG